MLASLLRTIRNEQELSQLEIAARLLAPQSFVSKYESGERRLDLVELRRIASALGVPLQTVVTRFEGLADAS